MNQEEKELLFKDLCARLPYGVILNVVYYDVQDDNELTERDITLTTGNIDYCRPYGKSHWVSYKPYLRPMSSMTEEEELEIAKLLNYEFYADEEGALCAEDNRHRIRLDLMEIYLSWMNKKMFDYRGLIDKGIAIAVTESNNPYGSD